MYQAIHYEVDGMTAIITLDRPDNMNTFVPPMLDEIDAAVSRATRDDKVRAIILSFGLQY